MAQELRVNSLVPQHWFPMPPLDLHQFLGVPTVKLEDADAVIVPVPVEKTVSYGTGTAGGPRAILEASPQIEPFDEETLVDFAEAPRVHILPPVSAEGDIEECLAGFRSTSGRCAARSCCRWAANIW